MKKTILTLAVILSLGGVLNAQYLDYMGFPTNKETVMPNQQKSTNELSDYTIVNVIPSHVQYGTDIAFDGTLIWVTGYSEYYIYGLNPENGIAVDSIAIDIIRPYGLTYRDGYFWVVDNDSLIIEKINSQTGEIADIINIFYYENTYPTSLVLIGDNIFFNDPRSCYQGTSNDYTRQVEKSGALVNNYAAKGEYPTGICYDGLYMWSTDNVSQEISKIDLQTFETVKTIHAPGGVYPNGLCFDGQYLWVQNNDADSIYQIDVGTVYTDIADNNHDMSFLIYPTIVKSSATIDCSKYINQEINLCLINQSGQIVANIYNGKLTKNTIEYNVNQNLPDGLYFCRISTKTNVQTNKIMLLK